MQFDIFICSLLSAVDESQEHTLIDAISALMLFCKSDELKAQGSPCFTALYLGQL